MSSLAIIIIAAVLFFLGYKFYAKNLELLWQIDPKRSTPAFRKFDSVDFVPAKNWLVLFGHHFASIAGAGPIIGPVIAVMIWGWAPAVVWVVLGTIFIGGVHDFGSLVTSLREGGSSIADIAASAVSRKAKVIFALFIWLALILVIAVFAWLCANTFVKDPKVVAPSLGLIPVAMLTGYLLYNRRANLTLVTVLGLAMLAGLILLGNQFPITGNIKIWLLILFIYAYIASVMPVNILLQPRDYLASFLLFIGVGAGYLSIVLFRPVITMPAYIGWSAKQGALWPMLFITVACGAVSGFHTLIASGTSSKQIANEAHAKRIGYGGMVAEGLVAILAIVAVAILFRPGDDLAGILKQAGPIDLFGRGYGRITSGLLGGYGGALAIIILNAFILTTLDTATRISRYITEELFKIKNRFISTFFIVAVSGWLALSGKWNKIWPAFGASNQLVAALALFVLSCWLITKKKNARFTLWPAFFMLSTTIAALVFQLVNYFKQQDYVLLAVAVILLVLSGFMVSQVLPVIFRKRRNNA
ncbi:carbon starvation protein A [Candidatus Omnitrophota bacterium]